MGEAKRRKKLDPNYGKPKPITKTVFEVGIALYKVKGRGILLYPGKGMEPLYLTQNENQFLSDVDRALLFSYDPETSILFSQPVVETSPEEVFQVPWVTTILKEYEPHAQLKIVFY